MRKCTIFVSIPGSSFFEEMYYKSIKPISEESHLDVFSFFDRPPVGEFSREIHIHIAYSNIVLAVINHEKPQNVLYEFGLAVGNGKPIIPITDNAQLLPSMIHHYGAIIYDSKNPNWERLNKEIAERCEKILTGGYMELRRRTHIELLVKRDKKKSVSGNRSKKKSSGDVLADAITAYKTEDYERVIRLLAPIVDSGIGDERTFFFLSDSYFLYGESLPEGEKKYTFYRKQLEVSLQGHHRFENHQDIHKNLGLAHLKLRELNKAQTVFEEIVKNHPNYMVARYNLACVYAQRGDMFACMEQLSYIIEKDSSWRNLARVDPDLDPFWQNDLFQRLLFPVISLS